MSDHLTACAAVHPGPLVSHLSGDAPVPDICRHRRRRPGAGTDEPDRAFHHTVASIATVPAAAVGLVILVRSRGLGWAELGLSRQHWKSGLVYALAAVALVVAVISVGVLLPITRPMFMNHHYATISGAVIASMVMIPLQTVIPEELAFRGVLHGALNRAWGFRGVAVAGSVLFGLWHIATSLGLTSSNVGFTRLFGGGIIGLVAGVMLAVLATGVAGFVFSWLRRRSGSLIAPIALHWSLNGMGALAAALVWHLST
ncbi:conserved integral membrane protein [Mycobacterium tuberculosis GM 1503]|nr:conserved integral membrane protein [Mycobacterium tuberculosis GM 1503]